MAVFTAVASGNWNDGATWGLTSPGVVNVDFPGVGDTMVMAAFTVTVPVGVTANVGTSPQDLTTRVIDLTNTTSKLLIYGTLNCYGNFAQKGSTANTCIIQVDTTTGGAGVFKIMSSANVTTPNRYRGILGYNGASQPGRIVLIGTSGARATMTSDVPGTTMFDSNNGASLKVVYGDVIGMTTSLDAQDASAMNKMLAVASGVVMETDHAVFDYCGQFVSDNPATACTSSVVRTKFKRSTCRRYNIVFGGYANNIFTLDRVYFDIGQGQVSSNIRYTNLVVNGGSGSSGYPTASATITGRYGIFKNRAANAGSPSTVSGAVRDILRWRDGCWRTITAVDTTNDVLTLNRAHFFTSGDNVFLGDYTGTLPTGLSASGDGPGHWVRSISSTEVSLHTSSADAIANTGRINITGTQTGAGLSLSNPHWTGAGTYEQGQIYFEDGCSSNGDAHNGTSGASALEISDCIGLMGPNGNSPGVLVSPLTSGTWTISALRNTWPLSLPYGLLLTGENYDTGHTGMIAAIQANLVFQPTYLTGATYALYQTAIIAATVNPLTPSGAKGNWVDGGTTFDTVGEVYELGGPPVQTAPDFLSASPPDLVNTAANFIDIDRNVATWAGWWGTRIGASGDSTTTPGTAATTENADLLVASMWDGTFAEELVDDGVRLCVEFLRRGLIPTNSTGRAVSVSSKTAGAYGAWAPALTSQTATAALGNVTTNCGDGTLYWIISIISTAPDWDRIVAAKDSTGTTVAAGFSGNQAVSGTGVQNITLSGATLVAATNYYLHVAHSADATANGDAAQDSYLRTSETVTSAAFQAAASVPLFMHNTQMRSAA